MTLIQNDDTSSSFDVRALLCDALNEDATTYAHPAIQGLKCLTTTTGVFENDEYGGAQNSDRSFDPVSQEIGAIVYLAGAMSAVVFILGVYGYRRRQKKKDEIKLPHHLDDSDLVNTSNSISFDGGLPYNIPSMDFSRIDARRNSYFPVSPLRVCLIP